MKDERKTKKQLIDELEAERQKSAGVDVSGVERQLAVERVRAAAMDMRDTGDLRRVVVVIFNEMRALGIDTPAASIFFADETADEVHSYNAIRSPRLAGIDWSPDETDAVAVGDSIGVRALSGTVEEWMETEGNRVVWGSGAPRTFEHEIGPDFDTSLVPLGLSEEEERVWLSPVQGHWFVTNVPFRFGMIGYREREHHPEHDEIVAELAHGLELGFLRFLDFRKVEAQNRELTIQNALERVRARALGMQQSAELSEVNSVLFEQFRGLGHDLVHAGIIVTDEASATRKWWVEYKSAERTHTSVPIPNHAPDTRLAEVEEEMNRARGEGADWFLLDQEGEVLHRWLRELFEWEGSSEQRIEETLRLIPERVVQHRMFHERGYVAFGLDHRLSADDLTVAKRFTDVFDFAYSRFLELQAAEERAREARIEAAIEHVRAEALSMRASDDLKKVLAVVFRELRGQDIAVNGFSALMYDEESGIRATYLAREAPPGAAASAAEADVELFGTDIAVFAVHLQRGEYPASSYERWRKGEIFHDHLDSQKYREHVQFVSKLVGVELPAPGPDAEFFAVGFPFAQGEFAAGAEGAFSEAEVDVMRQFAEAATIGYQRYLDFKSLEEANRQIQEATRHKSDFLASMSHDLRTPMNAIIGYTRILLRRTKDALDDRQYLNLENIQTSADNLLILINDILDLSKIEAGRIDITPGDVDLRQLVSDCVTSVLVKPDVKLEEQIEEIDSVRTDVDLLRKVVMNVIGNAAKFTEQGSITVSLKPVDEWIELSVADTGSGIPAEDLPHIFDEFRQVDREGGQEGAGMGLSIAKKSIELLGGSISAESEVGEGTTFTLRISDYQPETG